MYYPGETKNETYYSRPSMPDPSSQQLIDIHVILKPLSNKVKGFIRDDLDFLTHLPQSVPNDSIFVTYDVELLY